MARKQTVKKSGKAKKPQSALLKGAKKGLYSRPVKDIPRHSKDLCLDMMKDLQKKKAPALQSIKCSLDNSQYDEKTGYLVPKGKMVTSELNVSSVQKISRSLFLLRYTSWQS